MKIVTIVQGKDSCPSLYLLKLVDKGYLAYCSAVVISSSCHAFHIYRIILRRYRKLWLLLILLGIHDRRLLRVVSSLQQLQQDASYVATQRSLNAKKNIQVN